MATHFTQSQLQAIADALGDTDRGLAIVRNFRSVIEDKRKKGPRGTRSGNGRDSG